MRKLLTILLFVCLLCVPALALAENADQTTGDELLYNGDFSIQTESAPLPAGWELTAYQNDADGVSASVANEDGHTQIVLTNHVANDSRVIQEVTVAPNKIYRLSAEIRTSDVENGTGANLSIDNYPIDGTFCYSENLFGSDAWRTVQLYFRTGAEQTKVAVALRLGGYGTTATGTAEYRNVSLMECVATDAKVVDLPTENGTVSNQTDTSTSSSATKATANDPLYLAVAFTLVLGGAILWLYRNELRFSSRFLETVEHPELILMAILLGAFIVRVILSLIFYGHPTDINCFMAWGNMVAENGMSNFYTSGAFADYPPGYMYICGAISAFCRLVGIPYGSDGMALLFKMPSTFADLLTAYLLYRMAKKRNLGEKGALLLAGIYAFTPTLMFVSGAWGQIDSVLALLIAIVILLLQSDKRILAGAVYGLAILMKPQALMFGPILAVAFILDIFDHREAWVKKLVETVLAVVAAVVVLYVLALPFQGSQGPLWLIDKYSSTASSYHYASIEAFNFGSLCGWNWKTADTLILWMPYYEFGMGMIVLSTLFASVLYFFGRKQSRGALFLASGLAVLLIFTFGHYMHERYMLPALLLILIAYLYYGDRRLLAAFGGLTVTSFLNAACAYYVVNHQDARGTVYNVITFVGSLATVLLALYLSYVAFQILVQNKMPQRLMQDKLPQKRLPRRISILPAMPTDNKLHFTKRDTLFMLGITLVYGVVALTNLGSMKAPQTYWYSDKAGESVTVKFSKVEQVTAFSVFGNIDNDGTLLIATPDGHEEIFDQTYDDMFRWKKVTTDFTTDTVTLSLYSGSLKLNEIAFYDQDGKQIPVTVVSATGDQAKLFDEQNTVAEPSYYTGMYFDELYHGRTAYENLHNLTPYENSHPPLGKLFIMLGVWAFGMTPFGWRVVGALFGIGMLPVLYVFGKRLFKNSNYALVLTTLFAFDFMHFTQTRIATIDVYSVFFILLMYYYMYQYITMDIYADGLKKTLKPLALSGLFFGIGAACKWTSIYAGAGLAILLFGSLISRYLDYRQVNARDNDADKAKVAEFWPMAIKTLLWCMLFFIVIPFTIYFASYTPYYIYESGQTAGYGVADMFKTFAHYQQFMYHYHSTLVATHPYQSSWYSWPFTVKPMWYYFNSYIAPDQVSTLSASGNPAVWWVSSIGAVALLWARLSKRVKPDRAMQIFLVGILANFLPWVLVTRCTFIYHFFATVPFILMATVYALQKLEERYPEANFIKWVWVGFAVLFFVLLYPGLSGLAIPAQWGAFLSKLPGGKLMYGA